VPAWVETLEIAEAWGLTPWAADELAGEARMWMARRMAWRKAVADREKLTWQTR
jgi:hypothetical protein